MAGFRDLFHNAHRQETNKNRISRTSTGSRGTAGNAAAAVGRQPVFSVVTKKYQSESGAPIDTIIDDAMTTDIDGRNTAALAPAPTSFNSDSDSTSIAKPVETGRPSVRGGGPPNYGPIYRWIGLGWVYFQSEIRMFIAHRPNKAVIVIERRPYTNQSV